MSLSRDRYQRGVESPYTSAMVDEQAPAQASIAQELAETNQRVNRLLELERRSAVAKGGTSYSPDFEGQVTGAWVGLDSDSSALVSFNGKIYKTIRLGETSIPRGTPVVLFFASGTYYSTW